LKPLTTLSQEGRIHSHLDENRRGKKEAEKFASVTNKVSVRR